MRFSSSISLKLAWQNFHSFLSSVLEQFISINNCMPTWGGNQCDWGVRYPSWQLKTGITNHAKQIPERWTGICIRALTFLIDVATKRQLQHGTQISLFSVSFLLFFEYSCVLELSNSSPHVFLQFCFVKVFFIETTLLPHLCYILLLQLEARWQNQGCFYWDINITQQNNSFIVAKPNICKQFASP